MTDSTQALLDRLFKAGEDTLDRCVKFGEINSDAFKQFGEHQATAATAIVDLGARHLQALSSTREPGEWLQNVHALGEAYRTTLVDYVGGLRSVGDDLRSRYVDFAQRIGDAWLKAA